MIKITSLTSFFTGSENSFRQSCLSLSQSVQAMSCLRPLTALIRSCLCPLTAAGVLISHWPFGFLLWAAR